MDKDLSYIYGLLLTDGSMQFRNGVPISIKLEIAIKDKNIVEKLYNES